MFESVRSILTLSALVCIGAGALSAEDAPVVAGPAPASKAAKVEAIADSQFDTRIDTWVEGVIVKLDAAGAKISIAGHKMARASMHAAMINDIATKTAGLDPALRPAKADEIRLTWQEKLTKASAEEPDKDSEISGAVPALGKVLVKTEASLPDLDFLHHEKGMASVPAAPGDHLLGAPLPPARNDQATAELETAKSTEAKQVVALEAFGDLKVGEPVYVGMASGTFTNDVLAIIRRTTLKPTSPGKN